jgi:chromosome partitioning protein
MSNKMAKNKKIVFANQKGGVGKSTLCILFANYLAYKKQDVCIIDTDLQKTIAGQRTKDLQIFEENDMPYEVQEFDVQDPKMMKQLMDSASEVDGYVLFDSPGNVGEDGLVPMFVNADAIIIPYEYEDKCLDSTGTFVQVLTAIQQKFPQMKADLFFVPNKIDTRIGTSDEIKMWKATDDIFSKFGRVTPRVGSRATLKRINTAELLATQRDAVAAAFDYIIKKA